MYRSLQCDKAVVSEAYHDWSGEAAGMWLRRLKLLLSQNFCNWPLMRFIGFASNIGPAAMVPAGPAPAPLQGSLFSQRSAQFTRERNFDNRSEPLLMVDWCFFWVGLINNGKKDGCSRKRQEQQANAQMQIKFFNPDKLVIEQPCNSRQRLE